MEEDSTGKMKVMENYFRSLPVLGSIGLGALGVWIGQVGHGYAFMPASAVTLWFFQVDANRAAFYLGLLCCGLFLLVSSKHISKIRLYLDIVFLVLTCLGTVGFAAAWQQQYLDSNVLAIFSCLFVGMGYAWFSCSFYLALALNETLKVATIAVAVSILLNALVTVVVNSVFSGLGSVIIATLLLLLACIVSIALNRRAAKAPLLSKEDKLDGNGERYWVGLVLFALLAMFMIQVVSDLGLWGYARVLPQDAPLESGIVTFVACSLFILLVWPFLVRRTEMPLRVRYHVAFFVLFMGCIIYMINALVLPQYTLPISVISIDTVALFSSLMLWSIVLSSIKSLRFSGYQVLGAIIIIYGVVAEIWMLFFESPLTTVSASALIVFHVVVLFGGGYSLYQMSRFKKTAAVSISKLTDEARRLIQTRYSLTARECEVLVYLLQGRTRSYIQEKLSIAEGTVNSHVTHIYSKMGVSTRDEMFELINGIISDGGVGLLSN